MGILITVTLVVFAVILIAFALVSSDKAPTQVNKPMSSFKVPELKLEVADKPVKAIRTHNTMSGSLGYLTKSLKATDWYICVKNVEHRELNLDKKGSDRTTFTLEDYGIINEIMGNHYEGILLVMPLSAYKELEPNDEDVLSDNASFVAVTNKQTLAAALNYSLGLKKSIDSYYRAYNKTL